MGRAGITLQEVEKAVLQLQGRGKNPSVDAVREILGTGSKSTIAQHLRDWKAQQSYTSGKLPQELLAIVTGLWERLNAKADQRITEIENTSDQQAKELKQTLTRLQQDYAQLQKQFHQSEENRITERSNKERLEKELIKEQQEHSKLFERHQTMIQQLEDCKGENARLHQLANNIQANLEHYQNAMQQLRTEQTLAMEKQQIQFQQELVELQRDVALQRKKFQESEQQLSQKNIELQQIQEKHHSLQQEYEIQKRDIQENTHELIVFKERCEQYLQQLQIYKNDLTHKDKHSIECEKQIAILNEHRNRLQNELSAAEDKIELLRQEKLFLSQEKAELHGYLKQLEKTN
jgi:chromosome segregation ATPase